MSKLVKGVTIFITDVCPDGTGDEQAVDPIDWIHDTIYYEVASTDDVASVSDPQITIDFLAGLSNESLLTKNIADETVLPHQYQHQVFDTYNDRLLAGCSLLTFTPPLLGRAVHKYDETEVRAPNNGFVLISQVRDNYVRSAQFNPNAPPGEQWRIIRAYSIAFEVVHATSTIDVVGITRSGPIATVTLAANHGRTTGDKVFIYGAENDDQFNGVFSITVTSPNSYEIPCGALPTSATGTIKHYFGEIIDKLFIKHPYQASGVYVEVPEGVSQVYSGNQTWSFVKDANYFYAYYEQDGWEIIALPYKVNTVLATETEGVLR